MKLHTLYLCLFPNVVRSVSSGYPNAPVLNVVLFVYTDGLALTNKLGLPTGS